MKGRDSTQETKHHNTLILSRKKPVSFAAVRHKKPDRTYYIRDKIKRIQTFFTRALDDVYYSLWVTLSLDQMDFRNFKKYIVPALTTGASFVVGECLTKKMSHSLTENDENAVIFKFLLGTAILGYSATSRITEHRPHTTYQLSKTLASDTLGISYLLLSTFQGSQLLLQDRVSDSYALIASLGTTGLAMPAISSFLAQKVQTKLTKRQYAKGAQRSDTALISAGASGISNAFFQFGYHVRYEMSQFYRLFNMGLISHNILHTSKVVQQLRNFPALIADVGPPIVKKMIAQQERIDKDYQFNNTPQSVLKFTIYGPQLMDVPRYQLRTGDLVLCDEKFDTTSSPVSGEVVALSYNKSGFQYQYEIKKFSINLKAQNGEDVWIEHKTKLTSPNEFKKVDLHAIRDGKQAGVLVGSKLNLYDEKNFFIRIKEEKERTIISQYEKKAIINQIITKHKQKNVILAAIASLAMAGLIYRDPACLPAQSIRLLFDLFQMTIPFSETFLREMINSRLMKELNKNLGEHALETIDILRIVDLCNALNGYYEKKFPHHVAIISDKTGTLTTSKMLPLGIWTPDMKSDVQRLMEDEKSYLLPSLDVQKNCLDVFVSAYTNSKKELEPEEFALLQLFGELMKKPDFLHVDVLGNNHFRKTYSVQEMKKTIETFHLGLYRTFGGRFSLASDEGAYSLIFCGIPKASTFQNTSLLESYSSMKMRTGILSRDWCIAKTEISKSEFHILHQYFEADNKLEIEKYLISNPSILQHLKHYGTFIINNPVKKHASQFITQCNQAQIPVFIATGDTAKASENIAKVLCPQSIRQIITFNTLNMDEKWDYTASTVIFTGINEGILAKFQTLMDMPNRPVIIFSEMSTEGKGKLAQYLKNRGYFVVANGDGTNDVAMMKNSHFVIGHLTEDGTYAPGIQQFANLSDKQLQLIFNSDQSFYELCDLHQRQSQFINYFVPFANSQEKPCIALQLKSSKMGFELAQSIGLPAKEMWQQHWCSVAFDLVWLWITFNEINSSTDLPADNQNLSDSNFSQKCLLVSFAVAILQSCFNFSLTGESTNAATMLAMLSFLPFVLKSLFSSFGEVRDEIHPAIEEKATLEPRKKWGFFKSCFRKKPRLELEETHGLFVKKD